MELQATQQLCHLGEVIYFFLTSSGSADFSKQAIHRALRGRGMKCWVTAVAPLGQHPEGAVSPVCLPQLDRTVMLQPWVGSVWGQHFARILRLPQGASPQTLQLSWLQEAPEYAAAAVSRKWTRSLLCPDGAGTALYKTHEPRGYLPVIKMLWMEGKV